MPKYTWIGNIYSDWFRGPISPLDGSWRLPFFFKKLQIAFKNEFLLPIPDDMFDIKDGFLHIRSDYRIVFWNNLSPAAWLKILPSFRVARPRWERFIIPDYKKQIKEWKQVRYEDKSTSELWKLSQDMLERDVRLSMEAVKLAAYSFGFEIFLKMLFEKKIKNRAINYHDLLIGFPTETDEQNKMLHAIANAESGEEKKKKKEEFIAVYGIKKSDIDLTMPTLGEQEDLVDHMIEQFSDAEDPEIKHKEAQEKREKAQVELKKYMKFSFVTKILMNWIIKWAQVFVPIREARQLYTLAGTQELRRCLFAWAEKAGLKDRELVFFLTKEEIEKISQGESVKDYEKRAKERNVQWETQKEITQHEDYEVTVAKL